MIEVFAINRGKRLVLLSDDKIVPITNLYDWEGDEVEDWEDADFYVAGEDGYGWFWQKVSNEDQNRTHS